MAGGGYQTTADLPQVIPIFPLDGALLLPRGTLPLNIFEPRYLNMVDDAMSGDRLIGMIQTRPGGDRERPSLAGVGCVGRITSYAETADGRYLITLTGVCRFRVPAELPLSAPYRQVRADFEPFAADLQPPPDSGEQDRTEMLDALKAYLEPRGLDIDWSTARDAPVEALVNSLSMALPFEAAEKQAILEAPELEDRRLALVALMRIGAAGVEDEDDDAPPPSMQ